MVAFDHFSFIDIVLLLLLPLLYSELELQLRPPQACMICNYTNFQWTEDRQGFQIQYLTLDT